MKAQKTVMDCPNCGSPYIVLIQTDGQDKLFKCEACTHVGEYTKSGLIINPEIKKCENCGQFNGPEARVCQKRGTQISYECPNCGRLVDLSATYCPFCEIHTQNYLEERKRHQAEAKRSEILRLIQKLESEIKSLENDIDKEDEGIRKARAKTDAIRNSGGKLYYFGKSGLSEAEKSIHYKINGGIGCWTKVVAVVLALVAVDISWRLFIGVAGLRYNYFEPATFFRNESATTLYVIFCLSVFVVIGMGRLVYVVIMMLARQKSLDRLVSDEEHWLRDLQSEKHDLQNKLERLKRELAEARSQAL